ncbi:precorrin-3B synthase [Nonomuraea mangrovi]|uniref:Precorrin-3B synthase n=1 Tax=Nonomuraea mangrovi TaxID=2316207 RepID=A0ABW4SPQ7_9ACTN
MDITADIGDFSGHAGPDACPGALQVHTAADGALARVRIPGGALSPAQLRELAACAAELGSGVIELTSRANVQVRGLRAPDPADPSSVPAFAARMAAAGLLPSATHERVRNILASPLAGRVPSSLADVRPLVSALDRALCGTPELAGLSGRFLFALDDGTGDVLSCGADVTFLATSASGGVLLLGGVRQGPPVDLAGVVPLMLAAASAFMELGDGGAWRVRDVQDGPALLAARLFGAAQEEPGQSDQAGDSGPAGDSDPTGPTDPARPADPAGPAGRERAGVRDAGTFRQLDGDVALEVVIPLGRLTAHQAAVLADAAPEARVTPWRTVVLPGLAPDAVQQVADRLTGAGLVTVPGTPWAGLSACTGRPGCAKSLADVQLDARVWAERPDHEPAARPVHWAGCERRCGRPAGEVVDVVATPAGYRVAGRTEEEGT